LEWRFLAAALRVGQLPVLILLGLTGLAATAALGDAISVPGLCGTISAEAVAAGTLISLRLVPVETLILAWGLMVLAMMPPLLALPVAHVRHATLPSRRGRALAAFAAGYGAVWLMAGLALLPIAIAARTALSETTALPAAFGAALLWSASPTAQAARNRCHRLLRIGASGLKADRDCVRQGLATGLACTAACWPWMLVPTSIAGGHVAAMALVTVLIFLERLSPPERPRWRTPPVISVLAALRPPRRTVGSR
jgi:predicted metal-binding membrane protein